MDFRWEIGIRPCNSPEIVNRNERNKKGELRRKDPFSPRRGKMGGLRGACLPSVLFSACRFASGCRPFTRNDQRASGKARSKCKVERFGRTLYHLLGVDPDTTVTTLANRPMKLIVEETPIIREALV
jgi:hypothetical protein